MSNDTETIPQGKKDRIAKAQEAVIAMRESGLSPRERGHQRTLQVLDWVYKWGWTSSTVLALLTGQSVSTLTARLVKSGLLRATVTDSAGGVPDIPRRFFTLTQSGLDAITKQQEVLIDYDIRPERVNQDQLKHNGIAQSATARLLQNGKITDYFTEAMLSAKSEKNKKQHDAVWVWRDGTKTGLEVELSAKWERKLDQFIYSNLLSVQEKKVDKIQIHSDSQAIVDRYKEAFAPKQKYTIWKKNEKNFYDAVETKEVPAWTKEKVLCVLIKRF